MHDENPSLKEKLSKGNELEVKTNVFDTIPEVFYSEKPDKDEYIKILGRTNNERTYKYIKRKYVVN